MKRLQARTLKRVRRWLLEEEKPLSWVLSELGMTVRTWEAIKKTDPALRDIIDFARLREEEALIDKIKAANQHGAVGAMFMLKSRHGYIDQNKAPPPPPTQHVNIVVALPPKAQSAEEWQRQIIDVTPAALPSGDGQ